jgi:hypothetical protein
MRTLAIAVAREKGGFSGAALAAELLSLIA